MAGLILSIFDRFFVKHNGRTGAWQCHRSVGERGWAWLMTTVIRPDKPSIRCEENFGSDAKLHANIGEVNGLNLANKLVF